MVTMATRTKQCIDFESLAYGLSYGIQHFITEFWQAGEKD